MEEKFWTINKLAMVSDGLHAVHVGGFDGTTSFKGFHHLGFHVFTSTIETLVVYDFPYLILYFLGIHFLITRSRISKIVINSCRIRLGIKKDNIGENCNESIREKNAI